MNTNKLDQLLADSKERLVKSVGSDIIEKVTKDAQKDIASKAQRDGEKHSPEKLGLSHEPGQNGLQGSQPKCKACHQGHRG